MKILKNIGAAVSLLFAATSCSESKMDEINANPNNPKDVGSHLIITDCMTSSAFSVTGSDFSFYASIYTEHNAGVYSQFFSAETRGTEPVSSSTYNNPWGSAYQTLLNLKTVIEKCDEGGNEAGNYHTLGIAQILSAYNLAILTDLMGDIPWSEALQPGIIFTPKLDTQEEVYAAVMTFLDDAIANLHEETIYPSLGTQDFIYDGDIEKWLQFAYGLKARYTMRLSLIEENYQSVIDFANASFVSAGAESKFHYNGGTTTSPYFQLMNDRDYFGASQSLKDKLSIRKDPREAVYFKAYPETHDIVFVKNGAPQERQGYYGVSNISTAIAPTFLLSYHEIEFLKAEAYVRLNQLEYAKGALKNAIVAAFAKENIGLSNASADAYFTDVVEARFDEEPLAEVMNQKYLAQFEEESIEAYNDIRRLKAMGDDVISLSNAFNSSKFPLRFTYGADDVTTNANVREAYGDGTYVYSENVWWAGGTR